jgi:RNase P/RNase MRP subunit POP5
MLKRRPKRRYLSIVHKGQPSDIVTSIKNRHIELFGHIATERANIQLMRTRNNMLIIRCRMEQFDSVLVATALADRPMFTTGTSGSLKHLQKSMTFNLSNCEASGQ